MRHPPTTTKNGRLPHDGDVYGVDEQGPLVRQPKAAAALARILNNAAMELWDVCTYTDTVDMWEEARAIASRILAACPTK